MKRSIYFLAPLALLICLAFATPVYAAPIVYLNGQPLAFDVPPQVENNRTLVPFRNIFEALGAEVWWDEYTSTVTASKGNVNVRLQLGKHQAQINHQVVELDVPAQAVSGRTMVPLRFVSVALGADVDWVAASNAIYIDIPQSDIVQPPIVAPDQAKDPREIYKAANPAVVTIYTYGFYDEFVASGSGFIVDSNGTIVTNYHVIEPAWSAVVCLPDGSQYEVDHIMDYSPQEDIAVLKINARGLPTVKLGNSDLLENGEKIFTIGSPQGLGNTISHGLVSNKSRQLEGYSFIQISAPISPGSSGGALLNTQGDVIGITTAGLYQAQNINFAVPINLVRPYLVTDHHIHLADLAAGDAPGEEPLYEEIAYEQEPNNEFWLADWLELGTVMVGYFYPYDIDVYQLYVPEPAWLWATCFTEDFSSIYPLMSLVDSREEYLITAEYAGEGMWTLGYPVTRGYYYIVLLDENIGGSGEPYFLVAELD